MQWKEFFRKKENLAVMVLVGVLLLVAAMPEKGRQSRQGQKTQEAPAAPALPAEQMQGGMEEAADEYQKRLEKELTELLESMEGAGRVTVMVTLKSTGTQIVEKTAEREQEELSETDSQGGRRETSKSKLKESLVCDTGQSPYVVTVRYPEVEGVVVLAQGAGAGRINTEITQAVCALLNLELHKVKVLKRKGND